MSWVAALLLALGAFVAIAFVLKAPRKGREAIGAALALGIAGYAMQASPDLPGAPKQAAQDPANQEAAMVEARQTLAGQKVLPREQWVVVGDALARRGQFADAAGIYLGAVRKDAGNAEAWLAMANALVAHADGSLTPAAIVAYRRAELAAPGHPGPPFFFGLALAQAGRLDEGRAIWAALLEASPPDAPWREDIALRLSRLDELIRQRDAAGKR